jgi:hypothetical protein
MLAVKKAGLFRAEGNAYVTHDGEILNSRFDV